MPFVITRAGVFMLALGIFITALMEPFLGTRTSLLLSGLVLASTDLLYRRRKIGEWRSIEILNPAISGGIMFLPVWIIGILVIGFGILA